MSATVATDDPLPVSAPVAPTGRARLFPASMVEVVRNYLSAAALLVLGFAFYTSVPFYREFLTPLGLAAIEVVLLGYLLILPVFYATFPDGYAVKCRLFWRAIANFPRRRPTEREAVALRAVAVKMFFMPLMIYWLTADSVYLVRAVATPGAIGFYDLALTALIVTDLLFFTVGYGVEHPRLGNEIRSVEPTVLGWVAALVCYPPFQAYTMRALGWYPVEHPPAALPSVQVAAGCLMLALMGIYTWASVSLGLKASNLTNRGTVTHGPYAYVRHPAYIGKNLFWWVGCVPVFVDRAAAGDWVTFALIGLSLSAWSGIYVVRALTEERHLLRDPEYREYCERVRYRFIPGVW